LISIQNGTFYRSYPTPNDDEHNPELYPSFNFTLPAKPWGSDDQTGKQGQHWAVIGSAGKTALLEIFRGRYIVIPSHARSYPYLSSDELAAKDPRLSYPDRAIQYVGFGEEGPQVAVGTRAPYLSARYESRREDSDWSVRQYLKGQTSLNPLEEEEYSTLQDEAWLEQVVIRLKLEKLLDMPMANLSNGQTRRTRIAKALLRKPELLLLDEPFMGLDPSSVKSISTLLQSFAEDSSPRLVLGLRPQDMWPDWITHLLIVGNRHRVLFQGERSRAKLVFEVWKTLTESNNRQDSGKDPDRTIYMDAKEAWEGGILDRQLLWDLRLTQVKPTNYNVFASVGTEALVEMDAVKVQYGTKTVLGGWEQTVDGEQKEGLHWRVRRGQRWAILGANGSGKTTLLSLITSDHPQAYALPVRLFGRSRLPEPGQPGVSIFDLQSRIGHSSPEIHTLFPRHLTVRQSIESAWAETFLGRPLLDHDRDSDVNAALKFFKPDLDPSASPGSETDNTSIAPKGPGKFKVFPKLPRSGSKSRAVREPDVDIEYADSLPFSSLSVAQQRLVLFIRAVVHKPDLVILDEAFSGMSPSLRNKCIYFLEVGDSRRRRRDSTSKRTTTRKDRWLYDCTVPEPDARHRGLTDQQALIVVSHVKEEIPECVRHWMRLPSDDGFADPLSFQMGILTHNQSWDQAWDIIWSAKKMEEQGRRAYRRKLKDVPGSSKVRDTEVYELWSI
jgi:ABC-type molybdenum transport system ATPase subunit/photorepair protein PhrA